LHRPGPGARVEQFLYEEYQQREEAFFAAVRDDLAL
jgi:hypothetical protein